MSPAKNRRRRKRLESSRQKGANGAKGERKGGTEQGGWEGGKQLPSVYDVLSLLGVYTSCYFA